MCMMAFAFLTTYSHFNQLTRLQIRSLVKIGQNLVTSYTVETVPTVCMGLLHSTKMPMKPLLTYGFSNWKKATEKFSTSFNHIKKWCLVVIDEATDIL